MRSSLEEAILLLERWKESRALIQCSITAPEGAMVGGWVLVESVELSKIVLRGRSTVASFDPSTAAEFEYSEPRELGSEDRVESATEWDGLLSVVFPSGSSLLLGISSAELTR